MNFSNTSKLRKILSLILVMAMMATLFAGCKKDEEPSDTIEPNAGPNIIDPSPSEETSAPTETQAVEINENTATVLSQINIRSAPTTESVVVGNLYAGDRVEISRRENIGGIDWAYITTPQAGWIVMEYVQMDYIPDTPAGSDTTTPAGEDPTEDTKPTDSTSIKGVITANGLNVREGASKETKIVGNYSKGDVVTIVEQKNGWGRTDKGWILMDYVKTSGSDSSTGNQNTDTDNDKDNTAGNGSTTVQFKGIVTASELNIRADASTTAERVGGLNYGARVEILEKSGSWGRTKDGWISLDYVYQDGTTGARTAKGIVTGDELNIRSGPGTGYDSVGTLNSGDEVTILFILEVGDKSWGNISKGWISMDYVELD